MAHSIPLADISSIRCKKTLLGSFDFCNKYVFIFYFCTDIMKYYTMAPSANIYNVMIKALYGVTLLQVHVVQ